MNKTLLPTAFTLVLGLLSPGTARAATLEEDMLFFSEEAKVVTASRREQPLQTVPMAADVITSEEIEASGATSLWDLMRFRAGMDVLNGRSVDAQRGIVAIRGFPQEYVHNIQVLLDGRSVYEPIDGGAYWEELPVQMQDIERIEIIRGPNAALYGSGAALGVINIITRRPNGPTKVFLRSSGGSLHSVETAEAVESAAGPLAYRASHSFRYQDGFPYADGRGRGNDHLRGHKANIRTLWSGSAGTTLEFFTGGSWTDSGLKAEPRGQSHYAQDFEMLKLSQKLGDRSTVEVLGSRNNYIQTISPAVVLHEGEIQALQYDAEILHRLSWWDDRLATTYGLNHRHVRTNSVYYFGSSTPEEHLTNGYFNQSIQFSEKLALTGGVSVEHCNIGSGGTQPNYQVAPIWTPVPDHSLRASYSVAHTIPVIYATDAHQLLADGGLFGRSPELKPQTAASYEAGYRGTANEKRLQMNASLYYTEIHDIDTFATSTNDPAYAYVLSFNNKERAIARGVETELRYRFSASRSVYLNYTYEHISDWKNNTTEVTRNTPAHKVNFGGIAALGGGFTGTLNVGYKDAYLTSSTSRSVTGAVPSHWRLDARLAYALPGREKIKLFAAGQNLLQPERVEFADGLTTPRTFQGGVSIEF
ncbi:MAG: TonB-dependent receptor [Elusimicrobiota bacterium]|jgi:iron complex outermembrane receptor protein